MNLEILVGPLVGSLIGYCTNYIAVKMLFRPLRPIKLMGKTLPFTPGIIPKGKDRLANAIGNAVGNNLLTSDALKDTLLSDETKAIVERKLYDKIALLKENPARTDEFLNEYISEDKYNNTIEKIESLASEKIVKKIKEVDVGQIIAKEAKSSISGAIAGSFFAAFVNDSLIDSLITPIIAKVNDFVEDKAPSVIQGKIHEEVVKLEEKSVGELSTRFIKSDEAVVKSIMNVYEVTIDKKIDSIINGINFSKIVKSKIDEMDVKDLEDMLLMIMKKELNAIVNLGALIGFVLGCINIFV